METFNTKKLEVAKMNKKETMEHLRSIESNLRMLARKVEGTKDIAALRKEVFNLAELQLSLIEVLKNL